MKLKEIRQQYLIGLTELARRAGVSPQTILNIEQGKTKTQRMDITRKISQALGIPAPMIDEFTHLAGTMEELTSRLAARDGARVQAAIDESNRDGWVTEDELEQQLQAVPA